VALCRQYSRQGSCGRVQSGWRTTSTGVEQKLCRIPCRGHLVTPTLARFATRCFRSRHNRTRETQFLSDKKLSARSGSSFGIGNRKTIRQYFDTQEAAQHFIAEHRKTGSIQLAELSIEEKHVLGLIRQSQYYAPELLRTERLTSTPQTGRNKFSYVMKSTDFPTLAR
jgi:hypothetical protein